MTSLDLRHQVKTLANQARIAAETSSETGRRVAAEALATAFLAEKADRGERRFAVRVDATATMPITPPPRMVAERTRNSAAM